MPWALWSLMQNKHCGCLGPQRLCSGLCYQPGGQLPRGNSDAEGDDVEEDEVTDRDSHVKI